jgi:hypothetical protein
VAIGVVGLAAGLTFACGTFASDEAPATPNGDAADEDLGLALDSSPPNDALGPDAMPSRCIGFDVDASTQPPSNVCGGLSKNLAGDPNNCGLCGHVCLDVSICVGSMCQPFSFVTGGAGASLELASVDDTNIYWVDRGRTPNAVFRGPRAQASSESTATLLAEVSPTEPVTTAAYNALIADRIYVKTYSTLYQAPFDGGALTVFSTVSPVAGRSPLAASGPHLFQTAPMSGDFVDYAKSDGTLITKQTGIGGAYDLAVTPDGRYAFVIGRSAVDAGTVDGAAVTRGALYRYTIATHDMTLVATIDAMGAGGSVLAADDDYAYFPEGLAGSILQLAVDAPLGTVPTVLSKGDGRRVSYITADDARVYWFSSKEAPDFYYWDLLSVDKCGGADRLHLQAHGMGSFLPRGLLVQGPHLYLASQDTVYRIAK